MADEDKPLDLYTNSVQFMVSAYEVAMVFGLTSEPNLPPQQLVKIRMSPQHALVMSKLLQKHLLGYRENIGKIQLPPRLFQDMGIEVE
jgi:uncharacterized protein DUF3467